MSEVVAWDGWGSWVWPCAYRGAPVLMVLMLIVGLYKEHQLVQRLREVLRFVQEYHHLKQRLPQPVIKIVHDAIEFSGGEETK